MSVTTKPTIASVTPSPETSITRWTGSPARAPGAVRAGEGGLCVCPRVGSVGLDTRTLFFDQLAGTRMGAAAEIYHARQA